MKLEDLVKSISKLSKIEKELLQRSSIVRKGRIFEVKIPKTITGHFTTSYEVVELNQLSPVLPLVEKVDIVISPPESFQRKIGFHKMLLDLLLKLPQRFMDKNLSLDVTSTKLCQAFDID